MEQETGPHIVDLFKLSNVTGACTQNIFHFTEESISSAKNFLIQNEILVRTFNLMIEFCKNCIMPNSRPRIEFNKKGVCNACTNYIEKQSIDWAERKKTFFK